MAAVAAAKTKQMYMDKTRSQEVMTQVQKRFRLLLLGEVFCKIKRQSAIKLLVLYPRKLLKIIP